MFIPIMSDTKSGSEKDIFGLLSSSDQGIPSVFCRMNNKNPVSPISVLQVVTNGLPVCFPEFSFKTRLSIFRAACMEFERFPEIRIRARLSGLCNESPNRSHPITFGILSVVNEG